MSDLRFSASRGAQFTSNGFTEYPNPGGLRNALKAALFIPQIPSTPELAAAIGSPRLRHSHPRREVPSLPLPGQLNSMGWKPTMS
jgi:hypothetical protein